MLILRNESKLKTKIIGCYLETNFFSAKDLLRNAYIHEIPLVFCVYIISTVKKLFSNLVF